MPLGSNFLVFGAAGSIGFRTRVLKPLLGWGSVGSDVPTDAVSLSPRKGTEDPRSFPIVAASVLVCLAVRAARAAAVADSVRCREAVTSFALVSAASVASNSACAAAVAALTTAACTSASASASACREATARTSERAASAAASTSAFRFAVANTSARAASAAAAQVSCW